MPIGTPVRTKDNLKLIGTIVSLTGDCAVIQVEDRQYTYDLANLEQYTENELPPLGISVYDGVGLKDRLG